MFDQLSRRSRLRKIEFPVNGKDLPTLFNSPDPAKGAARMARKFLSLVVLHRQEGDLATARYWYAHCGRRLREGLTPEAELREVQNALGQ